MAARWIWSASSLHQHTLSTAYDLRARRSFSKVYGEQILGGPLEYYVNQAGCVRIDVLVVEDGASVHFKGAAKPIREHLDIPTLSHPPASPDLPPSRDYSPGSDMPLNAWCTLEAHESATALDNVHPSICHPGPSACLFRPSSSRQGDQACSLSFSPPPPLPPPPSPALKRDFDQLVWGQLISTGTYRVKWTSLA